MKIPANSLKELSRKLRGIGGELFNFDGKLAYSKVDNLDVVVDFPLDCTAPFAVSAEKFSQIAVRLDSEVDFTTTESKLVLKTKKSKLTLPITEARPAIKILQQNSLITVQQDTLISALNYALQATAAGSFFNYSGAVQLSSKYAAGTDGSRLAVCESGGGPSISIVIPAPAAQSLKIFTGKTISISENEQNHYFQADGTTLIARKLVKVFPDYEKLIPANTKFNFEFVREEMLSGLKSISPLAEEKVKIVLTCEDDVCIISLTSQIGSGDVTIPVLGSEVFLPTFSASLPFHFLMDFVESVRGPAIFLRCNSEKGSFLLESGKFKLIIAGSR